MGLLLLLRSLALFFAGALAVVGLEVFVFVTFAFRRIGAFGPPTSGFFFFFTSPSNQSSLTT